MIISKIIGIHTNIENSYIRIIKLFLYSSTSIRKILYIMLINILNEIILVKYGIIVLKINIINLKSKTILII